MKRLFTCFIWMAYISENLKLFLKTGNGPKKRGNGPKKEETDPRKEEAYQQTEDLKHFLKTETDPKQKGNGAVNIAKTRSKILENNSWGVSIGTCY